jgi:hypothetical protein
MRRQVVFGTGPVAVDDLPLDDLDRHALHRCLIVAEQLRMADAGHDVGGRQGCVLDFGEIVMRPVRLRFRPLWKVARADR